MHGHITPSLGVVAQLVERGHRVTYVTTDHFERAVAATGAEVLRYRSSWPTAITMAETDDGSSLLGLLNECVAVVDAAKAHFGDSRPDVVLYDMTATFAGRVLSRSWRLPAVQLLPNFASNEHFSLNDEIGRRTLARMTEPPDPDPAVFAEFGTRLGEFVAANGLDPAHTGELLQAPEKQSLVFVPRDFQYRGDTFGGDHTFVGPVLTDRAVQGGWRPPGDQPVLLVSLGSLNYAGQRDFFRTCVRAYAGLDWHVVVSTGPEVDPAELGSLPPNVEAHRQVPQLAILRHAGLFVTHAGMGGTMEALANGVPLLAVPQLPEQEVIAERVAELGLGRVITSGIEVDRLREITEEVVSSEAVRRATGRMRDLIAGLDGARRAADAVEAHLRSETLV
ncbi:macrolide family glycosyltransferase [Amycolatopsis sp. lyj-346]|uniref:macrolide family glycosyltransferase n=1 Tax=Amycolatopsis sp. lyj-346 TaxID=2789289 RepID=UPI00397BC99D